MHEYLDAENYIYKSIGKPVTPWGRFGRNLGDLLGSMATSTYRIFLKDSSPPQQHPMNSKHPTCLPEPVCLNRTSRNPIVYWNPDPIASGWIQVTSLTFTRLHYPRSAWWYVRSASRPLKTPAGRPVGVWESDPGKFTFWTQSHGGWVRKNFLLKIG